MFKLTPTEEYFYNLVKKGVDNYPDLKHKTGRGGSYVREYITALLEKGLITRRSCEHCNTGYIITLKK